MIRKNETALASATVPAGPARLYVLQLYLRPPQSGTLMPFSGELVHGALIHWLSSSAPKVAEWLHQRQKQRLFTYSGLRFNRPAHALLRAERENIYLPLDPKETYTIRITLLLGDLFPLFHHALTSFDLSHLSLNVSPFLRLGKQSFLLENVLITDDNPESWTGHRDHSLRHRPCRANESLEKRTQKTLLWYKRFAQSILGVETGEETTGSGEKQ